MKWIAMALLFAVAVSGCGDGGGGNPEQAQVSKLQAQVAGLQSQLAAAQANQADPAQTAALVQAQSDLATTKSALAVLQAKYDADTATLKQQLAAAQANQDDPTQAAALAQAQQSLTALQSKYSSDTAALQQQIDAVQATVTSMTSDAAMATATISALQQQIALLNVSLSAMTAIPVRLSADLTAPALGQTVNLTFHLPASEAGKTVTWTSSDPVNAPVAATSKVAGDGTATVTTALAMAGTYTIYAVEGLYAGTVDLSYGAVQNVSGLAFRVAYPAAQTVTVSVQLPAGVTAPTMNFSLARSGAVGKIASTLYKLVGATLPVTANMSASIVAVSPQGVATVTITDIAPGAVYDLQASAVVSGVGKTAGKAVALGGTSISGSITISTIASVWQNTITPASGYTAANAIVAANANGVYSVTTSTALDGSSQAVLSIYSNTGTLQNQVSIPAGSTASSDGIDTDGSNIYLASGAAISKYSSTGNLVWTTPLSNGPLYGVARYAAGVVYCGGGYGMPGGYVAAYNAANGQRLWSAALSDGAPTDLSVAGDVYVVTSASVAKRINASTGAVIWSQASLGNGSGWSIGATSEGLYVSGGWTGGSFFKKLALADGSLLIDKSAAIAVKQIFAAPAGIYTSSSAGIAKYDYSLNQVASYSASLSTSAALYLYGQQLYYSSYSTGSNAVVGRVNDVY